MSTIQCKYKYERTQSYSDGLANPLCRRRVLARDQLAIDAHSRRPHLGGLVVDGAARLDLVLEHEGHVLGHAHGVLLGAAKPAHVLSLQYVFAAGQRHIDESRGAVAHGRHHLAFRPELGDQRDRVRVRRDVEHGPVAARVEHRGELVGAPEEVRDLGSVLPQSLLGVVKGGRRRVVLDPRLQRAGVEGRDAALGRGDDELAFRREYVVWVAELGLGAE